MDKNKKININYLKPSQYIGLTHMKNTNKIAIVVILLFKRNVFCNDSCL